MNDLEFAVGFARHGGRRMVAMRLGKLNVKKKLDRTDVSDADEKINEEFLEAVDQHSGGKDSVQGEEKSLIRKGARRVWVIDPLDGTGEYLDPSVPSSLRTTCIGIALLVDGRLVLSVACNPFRNELFTTTATTTTRRNHVELQALTARPSRRAYDYAHWDDARFDLRGLEKRYGKPLGTYSAIYQACEVSMGRSAFAAFPGNGIHDIASGALLVARLGGIVTDFRGRPLNWNDLNHGVLYSHPGSHAQALRHIQAVI